MAALGGFLHAKGLLPARWSSKHWAVRPDFSYQPIAPNPGPLQPEDRLVFMHIEKTAGSTAWHVLKQHFRDEEVCPVRFGNLAYWRPEHLARYRFFSLHAHLRMLRSIPQPAKYITFLREPVTRLLSHYNFWRSLNDRVVEREGLDHIRFLKALKLKELLAPSSLSIMPEFWNLSAQRLAGDLLIAPAGRPWRDETEMLDSALVNLTNLTSVGITEFPELSFQGIAEDLGLANLYDGARINVTSGNAEREPDRYDPVTQSDLDEETLECVERATRLDRAVYDVGMRLFHDRLRRGVTLDGWVPPHMRTERLDEGEIVIGDDQRGAVLYGPYCKLPAGRYCATLWVQATAPADRQKPWSVEMDVCSDMSRQMHAVRAINRVELADRWFEPLDILFTLKAPASHVEIRLHASGLTALAVKRGIGIRLV